MHCRNLVHDDGHIHQWDNHDCCCRVSNKGSGFLLQNGEIGCNDECCWMRRYGWEEDGDDWIVLLWFAVLIMYTDRLDHHHQVRVHKPTSCAVSQKMEEEAVVASMSNV